MASPKGNLTQFQWEVLVALSKHTPSFRLTGGAVLVGWTLKHRHTDDLDLFTGDGSAMASVDAGVRGAANEVGASIAALTTTPDFHRYLLTRGEESVRADFVCDRTPQLHPTVTVDGVTMDAVDEIVANKIAALVGRSEVRDAVDLLALERLGFRVEDHLEAAKKKDAGVSPATLAWLLSSMHAPSHVEGATKEDLEAFLRDLERRMLERATP